MTLSTNIYVLDEIDPKVVFEKGRELLGCTDDNPWIEEESSYWGDGRRQYMNTPGQGLDAWLTVYYRPDGPFVDEARAKAEMEKFHEEYCVRYSDEPDDCLDVDTLVSYLTINFDTAYGYSDEMGRGCSQLHADYIINLGQWLDVLGIRWRWENEFTGEVFDGYQGLIEFAGEGLKARDWFNNVVKPAVQAEYPDVEFN